MRNTKETKKMNSWLAPIYSGIISLLLGYAVARIKSLKNNFEKERSAAAKESKLIKESLGALLRNDMFAIYEKYKGDDLIPLQTQEEMESLWQAYHGLGFNHAGDTIHSEIMAKKPIVVR